MVVGKPVSGGNVAKLALRGADPVSQTLLIPL